MHCAECVGCDPSPSMCEHGMDPGLLAVEILLTFQPSLVSLEAHMQGGPLGITSHTHVGFLQLPNSSQTQLLLPTKY